jgi:hypothetical protein
LKSTSSSKNERGAKQKEKRKVRNESDENSAKRMKARATQFLVFCCDCAPSLPLNLHFEIGGVWQRFSQLLRRVRVPGSSSLHKAR